MSEPANLTAYLEERLPIYLEDLRELCAIECPTSYKLGVDAAGFWVQQWVSKRPWEVAVVADPLVGDNVIVTVPGGHPAGPQFLLAAHLDTVYPIGIAAERPMWAEGDRVLGPATADNKSGLLSALYAMAALEDLNLLGSLGGITLVCGGDEETDMRSSGAVLQDLVPSHQVGLVLEAGRENGDIVAARKGSGWFTLQVRGREAHAGVEPHKGANAIVALAHQVLALHLLNGMRPGVTVNVGVIAGGTLRNVVPGSAQAAVDVRLVHPEDVAPVDEAIRRIAGTTYVPGTEATLTGAWTGSPMPLTPAGRALAGLAARCAEELGFELAAAETGGVSYANLLAAAGLPVLDGLGPVGGLDHSPNEYILASSIVPRTALLALFMLRYAENRHAEKSAPPIA